MLARTILTPDELGIAPWFHSGLMKLRNDLADGKIKHDPFATYVMGELRLKKINMRYIHCGSVGCIWGWVHYQSGRWKHHLSSDEVPEPLQHLCLFERSRSMRSVKVPMMDDIKPKEIVKAIDNYLAGAFDPWEGIYT